MTEPKTRRQSRRTAKAADATLTFEELVSQLRAEGTLKTGTDIQLDGEVVATVVENAKPGRSSRITKTMEPERFASELRSLLIQLRQGLLDAVFVDEFCFVADEDDGHEQAS
ncbi:hypothetical protein H6G00_01675 [Leptolyngbya sp. FACHB-541]|uniref:hypothetical protein n=1 Tax=Leptolyngbya sp. FACHB-541 TaxID=2692810 RepID=UPI001686084A|nr:hypothetical protein [Leptolyngbya sp. FACHB-541]MBD1995340.1 hypothetical protein [Leptolyngbya sp. FACHB-541]